MASALAGVGIPRPARILLLGGGSASAQKQLAPIMGAHDGPIFLADAEGEEAGRVKRVGKDPFVSELPDQVALCIAMPALARMPDVLEGLLYDSVHPALGVGGIVAVPIPRDVTDSSLIAQGATLSRTRIALQSFLQHHLGSQVVAAPDVLRRKFEACTYFECVALASRTRPAFSSDPVVWLILRKRTGVADAARRAFSRTSRSDQFSLSDLEAFVFGLKEADIAFLSVDRFNEQYASYLGVGTRRRKKQAPCGLLKFDIHGNVRRAVDIAAMLHRHDAPGLFLMMHRHPLNQEFYDSPSTWRMLHDIQAMGHEIGIHADPFCLIRETGSLHKGLDAAVEDMRGRGLTIRAITLHGDTREHIKARGLQANDFFREKYRRSKWDGQPPEGEEGLAEHVYMYSYRRIANQLGLEFFAEVNFLHGGKPVSSEPMLYVSDNARAIRISSIPKTISSRDQISTKKQFVIDGEFVREAADILRQRPFLALFHPQWYW